MPIYEYRCPDCGHQFEAMQKFSDDPITVCPSCSAEHVKKLISAPAFHLKGGGWYKDHYGLKSGGASGSADGGSSSTSSAGTSSSSASSAAASSAAAPSAPAGGGSAAGAGES